MKISSRIWVILGLLWLWLALAQSASATWPNNLSIGFLWWDGIFLHLGYSDGRFNPNPIAYTQDATMNIWIDGGHHQLAGDVNGDGYTDFVTVDENGNGFIRVRLNNRNGTFTSEIVTSPVTVAVWWFGESPDEGTHIGDINGDGLADVVYMFHNHVGSNGIYAYLSNGDGTFSSSPLVSQSTQVPDAGAGLDNNVESELMGDFNGDGLMDLYHSYEPTNSSRVYLSNGTGYFGPAILTTGYTSYDIWQDETEMTSAADVDGDWDDDIIHFRWWAIRVWKSNGDGTFQLSPLNDDDALVGGQDTYSASFAGDTNNDWYADLIWVSESTWGYSMFVTVPGNGDGTFSAAIVTTGAAYPTVNVGMTTLEATHIGYFMSDEVEVNLSVSTGFVAENQISPVIVTAAISWAARLLDQIQINIENIWSATSGSDFSFASGKVITIPANSASGSVLITLIDDNSYEGNETIQLAISSMTAGVTGASTTWLITIIENDLGGGKRYVPPVDNCPDGDTSPTQYDGLCSGVSLQQWWSASVSVSTGSVTATWNTSVVQTWNTQTEQVTTWNTTPAEQPSDSQTPVIVEGSCGNTEYDNAYAFAKQYSITTMSTCQKANMDGVLLRKHAAKMIVNFAKNILNRQPNTSVKCSFSDMANENEEMIGYALEACQLGIMGLKWDGTPAEKFEPNGLINKAQLATILSRLLYGDKNNSDDACWYCKHIDVMKADGVITVTTDLMDPIRRAWAMLMMMRVK